jgi:hypothetical protein
MLSKKVVVGDFAGNRIVRGKEDSQHRVVL